MPEPGSGPAKPFENSRKSEFQGGAGPLPLPTTQQDTVWVVGRGSGPAPKTGSARRPARTARQRWAAPGSPHDRLVAVARLALPMGVGVLAAFLVMAPLTSTGDVSFVLDKNKVEVARERMRLQSARYRGQDDKGQAFELDAGSAVQRSSAEPIVRLSQLSAAIQMTDGVARLVAPGGRYDMDTQRMRVTGPVAFRAANGYRLDTGDAIVDLQSRKMESVGAVSGTVPQGVFSADRMHADLESRTVVLEGNARLRIVPRGPK